MKKKTTKLVKASPKDGEQDSTKKVKKINQTMQFLWWTGPPEKE